MFLHENTAADLTIILPPGTVPSLPRAACLPVGDRHKRTAIPSKHLLGVAAGLMVAVLPALVSVIPSAAWRPDATQSVAPLRSHAPRGNEEKFGTAVDFLATPAEAAQQAKSASKLLFLLHVSGNFEDPQFT